MKILIVDDSSAMRMIVRRTLREAGYGNLEVLQAGDGNEALAVIHKEMCIRDRCSKALISNMIVR